MSITLIIVILTAIVSLSALSNERVINDLIFTPPAITYRKQWYRFFSCALIHADIPHLAFNMFSLYAFGEMVESYCRAYFEGRGPMLYILLYVLSQFVCLIPTYFKHKDDYAYRSLGASGAVSAIVFAGIFLAPLQKVGIIFIPVRVPGFIFGIAYLAITAYLDRKGGSRINHSAHFYGALAGIVLLIIFGYLFSPYNLLQNFIYQVNSFSLRHLFS